MTDAFITIIGTGIEGTMAAYQLSQRFGSDCIFAIDKNKNFPGENQSSRSSGVLHASLYYDPVVSPVKAYSCLHGNEWWYEFGDQYSDVPLQKVGKFVVAQNEVQDSTIERLFYNARRLGVPNVKKISGEELREREPNVAGYSALWVPTSGIIDVPSAMKKLRSLAGLGDQFMFGKKVTNIEAYDDEFVVTMVSPGMAEETSSAVVEEFTTRYIVNTAGVYSDKIAKMVNPDFPYTIFPVRGESAIFTERPETKTSSLIYPAPEFYEKPDGTLHCTVGVHTTKTFAMDSEGGFLRENGCYVVGKDTTLGPLNRRRGDIGLEDYGSDLAPPERFYEEIRGLLSSLQPEEIRQHQTGIQAVLANSPEFQANPDLRYRRMINFVGICSPGITAVSPLIERLCSFVRE